MSLRPSNAPPQTQNKPARNIAHMGNKGRDSRPRPATIARMPKKPDALEQVWTILTNPRRSIVSVAALAAEHGFTDLAKFNKAFRERYGSSPVAIRKAVRKGKIKFGAPKR